MTNKKNAKRAFLMSLVALVLCFTMLLGTTYAWFTDSVTSGNNIIKSGRLDVELEYWDGDSWENVEGSTALFDENALWEPGYTEVVYLKVANVGTLAFKYQLGVNIVSETAGTNVAGETFKLSDYIYFDVVDLNSFEVYADRDAAMAVATDTTKISEGYSKSSKLYPVDTDDTTVSEEYVALVVYMPTWVENEANYKTGTTAPAISLGVNVLATQYTYESDSLGNDYDAEAVPNWSDVAETPVVDENGTVEVWTAEQLAGVLSNLSGVKTIALMANIDLEGRNWTPANLWRLENTTSLTIDGNGYSISNMTVDGQKNVGFIGCTDIRNLTIKNLTFENADVTGNQFAGVVIGYMYGEVEFENVDVKNSKAAVLDTEAGKGIRVGGLVGFIPSDGYTLSLTDCDVTGSTISGYHNVGAMVGTTMNKNCTVVNSTAKDNTLIYRGERVGAFNFGAGESGYVEYTPASGFTAENNLIIGLDSSESGLYWNGNTTKHKSIYYIFSAEDLKKAAAYFIGQQHSTEGNVVTLELMADIDLSDTEWEAWNVQWITLNGNKHKISNLTVEGWKTGLFGYAGAVTINDLTLENVSSTGAQAGIFAGSGEGLKINNSYLKGANTVTYRQYDNGNGYTEKWGGIGAITGILQNSNINVEITSGTTVALNKTGMETMATYVDNLTGYSVENKGINKGIVENNGNVTVNNTVTSADDLVAALKNGENVILANDIESTAGNGGYNMAGLVVSGSTLDGNDNTLTVNNANNTWDCAIYTTGGSIKNLTISGAFRGIFTAGCSSDIIIDNVCIDNVCYTISSDGSNPDYSIIVTDSTLNGWTSYTSGYKSVSFTNCNFGKGTGGYQYAFCRPYSDTTFTNCKFEKGYEFDATKCTSTFVNCYVGDTLITADNVVALLGEDAANIVFD